MCYRILILNMLCFSFWSCNNQTENAKLHDETKIVNKDSLIKIGSEIASTTQKSLGKNLMDQININGLEEAISFCNTNAIPITKNLESQYKVQIQRISDKNRNENNIATEVEIQLIHAYQKNLDENKKTEATIVDNIYYAPIITMALCMNCHGEKSSTFNANAEKALTALYPKDKATGYKENQVRGLWKIEFE